MSDTPPAISVVMNLHNREKYVEEAVRSVLAQTRRDFELIVWDDGSTDSSATIVERLAVEDSRVRVVRHEHRGAIPALKGANELARGRYVGWLDSDDLLGPTALEEAARLLDEQSAVGMVYTDHVIMDEAGKSLGLGARCKIPYSRDRLLVDFLTFHFRLFRREVYERVGGIDDSYTSAADYDFCLRMSEVTEIRHLPRPLYYYRSHPRTISTARRLEQIELSARAIRAAMERRGMSAGWELDVELIGRFSLRKRPDAGGGSG